MSQQPVHDTRVVAAVVAAAGVAQRICEAFPPAHTGDVRVDRNQKVSAAQAAKAVAPTIRAVGVWSMSPER